MSENRDWSTYNKHLVERGGLDFFLERRLLADWEKELRGMNRRKIGNPFRYSDSFIAALHRLKCLFHLAYRQLQGFAASLARATVAIAVPHFTTIQKRLMGLHIEENIPRLAENAVIAIDSTGLKVVNSGEWISRYGKRKGWVKLHAAVDACTHKFVVVEATKSNVADTARFPSILKKSAKGNKISKVLADAAYDSDSNFGLLEKYGIKAGIRLRQIPRGRFLHGKRARLRAMKEQFGFNSRRDRRHKFTGWMQEAQERWKKLIGFGQRWQVEANFGSFKGIFGEHVYSKKWDLIRKEILLKVNLFNSMIS